MTPTGGGGTWPNNKPTHRATSETWHHWCGGRRRAPEGPAAVPVGGGARPGNTQTPPTDWRPPRGLRGLAGLRDDAPSDARGADGERAGRPRDGRRSVGATSPPHTPRRHNKTARPHWGRAAVAVALGFEPRVAVTPHSISSAAPSAARTRYLTQILYYTLPLSTQIDRASWEQGHTTAWEQGQTATRPHAAPTAPETGTGSTFRSIENEIK